MYSRCLKFFVTEQLGNRLEQEGQLKSAQLCYICAGSFDRLVNSWGDNTSLSSDDLQDLVELVAFLQKAVERQGRCVEVRLHSINLTYCYEIRNLRLQETLLSS